MTLVIDIVKALRESEYRAEISAELEGMSDEQFMLAAADEIEFLSALLARYRDETPLGNQPHMIAHEADAALGRPRSY